MIRYPLALVCIFLAINIFFEISDIQVQGNVIYSSQEIQDASGLRIGGSGLMILEPLTRSRIRKALGNVTDAEISLQIPDTVVITVSEMVAIARLETGGQTLAITDECRLLGNNRVNTEELLLIRGFAPLETEEGQILSAADADQTKLTYLQELLPLLEERGMLEDVSEVDVTNPSGLSFRYLERFTVRLGKQDNLAGKLKLMKRIVDTMGPGDSGILDMSTNQEGHYIPD